MFPPMFPRYTLKVLIWCRERRVQSSLKGLCLFSLLISPTAFAQPATIELSAAGAPIIDLGSRFIPPIATGNMVVGPERLASEAGLSMLKAGGNAVDAAVATGFALAVTLAFAFALTLASGLATLERRRASSQTGA